MVGVKIPEQNILSSWTWKSFLFVGIFHLLHLVLFGYGWCNIIAGPPLPGLSKLDISIKMSRGAALPLSLDMALLLLPMCRISAAKLKLLIKWIPLEVSAWFHRQIAYTMLFYTIVHTASHFVNFFLIEVDRLRPDKAMQIHYTQAAGITGHVMIFCMVIIYTFAHENIRRQAFEAFQWGHRLYIVFLFASWTHGAGCFVRNTVEPYYITDPKNYWAHCVGYQSWRWETWFSVLYIIERLYAYFYYRRKVTVSTVLLHPSDVMEIRFDKAGMNYRAGQWIFLKCPRLSNMEWHPFSISSCPYDAYMSVHIRQAGDFTSAFRGLFNDRVTRTPAYDIADFDPNMRAASVIQTRAQTQEMPEIIVEGPYGSPAEDMFGNEVTVLIGAGIGVTPWASVLKSLWHLRDHKISKSGHRLRRVEFIWTCRDLTMFEWFQNLITSLNEQSLALKSSDKSIRVSCHTYITRPTDAEKLAYAMPQESTSYEDPDAAYDQLRDASLQRVAMKSRQNNNIHLGRPNFKTIFRDIKQNIDISTDTSSLRGRLKGRDQIGVNFCGPKSMARDVRKACAEATTAEVKFRFTKEAF